MIYCAMGRRFYGERRPIHPSHYDRPKTRSSDLQAHGMAPGMSTHRSFHAATRLVHGPSRADCGDPRFEYQHLADFDDPQSGSRAGKRNRGDSYPVSRSGHRRSSSVVGVGVEVLATASRQHRGCPLSWCRPDVSRPSLRREWRGDAQTIGQCLRRHPARRLGSRVDRQRLDAGGHGGLRPTRPAERRARRGSGVLR